LTYRFHKVFARIFSTEDLAEFVRPQPSYPRPHRLHKVSQSYQDWDGSGFVSPMLGYPRPYILGED